MTKADLINEVMEAIGPGVTKKDCSLILEGFLKAAKRGLVKGETIEIRGFGTLAVKKRKSRVARNPKTGKVVQVPAIQTFETTSISDRGKSIVKL